ncbi:MAG: hypothetical protein KGI97_01330 [Alphaproteobacteria bacterium]|nr:hypothetical protein [Alphaproteobacteria bacterium]
MSALPVPLNRTALAFSPVRNCSLLAITLGLQTGWAVHERDGDISFNHKFFRSSEYEGEGMKFVRFRYWLDEISKKYGAFDAVVFADVPHHSSMQSAIVYGGFLGHLTGWCDWRQIPYIGVAMPDVHKLVTGGNGIDQQSLLDALRRKGFIGVDRETVGALAVLDWALHYKARGNA